MRQARARVSLKILCQNIYTPGSMSILRMKIVFFDKTKLEC